MKRLGLSLLAIVGLAGLCVAMAAYERTFHPRYATARPYDKEPY